MSTSFLPTDQTQIIIEPIIGSSTSHQRTKTTTEKIIDFVATPAPIAATQLPVQEKDETNVQQTHVVVYASNGTGTGMVVVTLLAFWIKNTLRGMNHMNRIAP